MNENAAVSTIRLSFDCGSHNEILSKGQAFVHVLSDLGVQHNSLVWVEHDCGS